MSVFGWVGCGWWLFLGCGGLVFAGLGVGELWVGMGERGVGWSVCLGGCVGWGGGSGF